MISLSQLNEIQVIVFGLILLRMMGFVFSAAILNSPSIPVMTKILFSMVLAMLMYGSVANTDVLAKVSASQNSLLIMAILELMVGLLLGFLTRVFFFSVSMAGELISVSMGLGQAQMFNPLIGNMGNAMEQFFVFMATLLFFAINGHHHFIFSLIESFKVLELAPLSLSVSGFDDLVISAQQFFILGIKLSAPVMVSMIVVQMGVGLLSRAVPQINVITTTATLTAALGFLILFVSVPLVVFQMTGLIDLTSGELIRFLRSL
jgi:flagellar biosynthesis protein FliR